MIALPASRFLADFSPAINGPDSGFDHFADGAPIPSSPEQRRVDEARTSFERGFAEGRASAEAVLREVLREEQKRQQDELERERHRYVSEERDRLALEMKRGLDDVEAKLAHSMANLLEPFLEAALHRRAIEELTALVRSSVHEEGSVTVRVSGSPDLARSISQTLDARVIEVPAEGVEVMVVVDGAILETRLATWIKMLEQACHEQ